MKFLPISNINAEFLIEQSSPIIEAVQSQPSGHIVAIIADGHKTNQNCFKNTRTLEGKPWLSNNGTFLLHDYVHVMKCVRNNWLIESCGEQEFEFEGKKQMANWSDLKLLYDVESESLLKLSN